MRMHSELPACWLLSLVTVSSLTAAAQARALRKVHATIPYQIEGKQTVVGPDGSQGTYAVGGQVLLYHTLQDNNGVLLGHMAGHCHIVSKPGDRTYIAVCTKHLDWSDGSTMTAHGTEAVGPDNKPINARLVIAGGIGKWEGAHGEDISYYYDPVKGKGSGKVVLTCLKGVC